MRWSIKSPDDRSTLPGEGSASNPGFSTSSPHTSPRPGWSTSKCKAGGTGAAPACSTPMPAQPRQQEIVCWGGWFILSRQKWVWLTFVLLMFHSVGFFSYHGNFNIMTKHLLFLSEPSLLSCPVGYFGRQGLFFSSGGVAISYQIPPPGFPALRRFSVCKCCVSVHGKKMEF